MAFGSPTDYFGFADTNVILQSSDKNGAVGGNAQALNAKGDAACETVWGDYDEFTSVYKVVNGANVGGTDTGAKVWPVLGAKDSSSGTALFVTSVAGTTSNTDYPEITVTGRTARGDADQQYTIAGVEIDGDKTAQLIGVTATGSAFVTGSSFTANMATEAVVHGATGDEAAIGYGGGRIEASADLNICTGTPAGTADSGWTDAGTSTLSSPNTDYETATVNVFKNILADT